MSQQHEYTDFQVHFETCPHCRRDRPCPAGERAKQRDERRAGR